VTGAPSAGSGAGTGGPGPGGVTAGGGAGDREAIRTERLDLVPLTPADAAEMVTVLGAPELYEFIGGAPPGEAELRARYVRQSAGRSPDGSQDWRNWVIRERPGGAAVGTVQATIAEGGTQAEIAWVVGLPWQRRGYAAEAARAVVGWLDSRGVRTISANIHPQHHASAAVARRAGLSPTEGFHEGERVWQRDGPPPG
jgi:RimJ/RimL family protein N-acetyltransferase